MDSAHRLLLVWTVVIFYVTGQTWFAQLVVYPLFGKAGSDDYRTYHKFYGRRIPVPVIPPSSAGSAGSAGFLVPIAVVAVRPEAALPWMALANAGCGLVGLAVTVGWEIPRHARLEREGKQEPVIRELIPYNRPRALALSGAALLTLLMLTAVLSAV